MWRLFALVSLVGCMEQRRVQPEGDQDAAPAPEEPDAAPPGPTVDGGGQMGSECDMTGRWIVVQVTRSQALGATQKSSNWFFHEIEQTGDELLIVDSLNCGFRVTGTTTVTLPEATLEALAQNEGHSTGRKGTFAPTGDGSCQFDLERTYNLRGANEGPFLTDHWMVGDPPVALSTFPPLPKNAAEGMADWDGDGKEGITLSTGLGERYVAQRDWNEHHGTVPAGVDTFGGDGVIVVTWDGQEAVSTQTSPLLQTGSTPQNPGYAFWKRVGADLDVVTSGAHPELETCKNVQRLALEEWPSP
jgi:hypothetical protein